jgi:protein gp37
MQNSKIQWTTHTFNPWVGCAPVSAGCFHCYAATQAARYSNGAGPAAAFRDTAESRGAGDNRRAVFTGTVNRTSERYWRQPRAWDAAAKAEGVRPRVFCASMADWLHEAAPVQWLADLLALVRATPCLDWLLLSKRPEAWGRRLLDVCALYSRCWGGASPEALWCDDWLQGRPPPNVWVGATVEDQQAADTRIPQLTAIPARVRFLSCEPLLGPVSLHYGAFNGADSFGELPGIHWGIIGGESGPRCRPMDLLWADSLVGEFVNASVPVFVKQLGGHPDKRGDIEQFPEYLRIREFPCG